MFGKMFVLAVVYAYTHTHVENGSFSQAELMNACMQVIFMQGLMFVIRFLTETKRLSDLFS